MAQYLSKQGYIVFVSCHPEVRKFLSIHNQERFCAIFPSRSIKSDWLNRLRDRYEQSLSEKDLRALEHAENFMILILLDFGTNVNMAKNIIMMYRLLMI